MNKGSRVETHGSAKKRTELENLLMQLNAGDVLIVESFYTLADTSRHLLDLLRIFEKDQVTVKFLKEEIDDIYCLDKSFSSILKNIISFQEEVQKQTTIKGLVKAKEQGKVLGRPKKSDDNIKKAIEMYHAGTFTLLDIKNETGISKSTLYRYLESSD